jgi:hypothetical protein
MKSVLFVIFFNPRARAPLSHTTVIFRIPPSGHTPYRVSGAMVKMHSRDRPLNSAFLVMDTAPTPSAARRTSQ